MRAGLLGGAPGVALVLAAVLPGLAAPQTQQNSTTTYDLDTRDVNGAPMPGISGSYSRAGGETRITETRQSLNGHSVPAERVEERVVRDEGGVRVVERQIERYDPNGNPLPREKQVVTTTTHADGSMNEQREVWRGDFNGNMALAERTGTESRRNGSTVTSETTVERPSLNASMDVVEKRKAVRTDGAPGAYEQNETVWRNGQSGFYEAVRRITEHHEEGGRSSQNTAEYEIGATGALVLNSQTVRNAFKAPDGSQTTETTYLDRSAAGSVVDASDPGLKLRAQEIVERAPGPGGSVRETVSVRRPSISDPGHLDPARKISETVCHGDCSADRP
ncbi:MAG: hypothetical protein ABSF98_11940 [Bryobacteraceae bacterium]|jgi:hypothetical protein